jgi:hypothetical protein
MSGLFQIECIKAIYQCLTTIRVFETPGLGL